MGDRGFKWTSQYGSVIVSVYEAGTADGMNEQGLVANLLFLVESEYPSDSGDRRPQVSIAAWTQYLLDNFATVAEAVAAMRKEAFRPVAVIAPNGVEGKIHLSISDATGDSAIFEYLGGKLVIHHGRQYQVMTNSPTYDQQLALNEYWKQIGGTVMLPHQPRRRPARGRRGRLQRDAQRQRPARDQHAGPAQPFVHPLADRRGPEKQGLLLRGYLQPHMRQLRD